MLLNHSRVVNGLLTFFNLFLQKHLENALQARQKEMENFLQRKHVTQENICGLMVMPCDNCFLHSS